MCSVRRGVFRDKVASFIRAIAASSVTCSSRAFAEAFIQGPPTTRHCGPNCKVVRTHLTVGTSDLVIDLESFKFYDKYSYN